MATAPSRHRFVRGVFLVLGLLSITVAVIGIIAPIVPVTFPTLLAAYFFARSSPRFEHWLTEHRLFGSIVRDWRAGAGFTVRAKVTAVAGIVASFVLSGMVAVHGTGGRVSLAVVAVAVCAYVASRPTKKRSL